jgi:uncharacterized protein YkwD
MRISHLPSKFALAFVLFLSSIVTPAPTHAQSTSPADLFFNEAQTVYLINLERRAAGLAPVRWNMELTQSARTFAENVVANQPPGYCGHIDSEGRTPDERIRLAGYTKLAAWGENSVCGYTTPEAAARAWMNSDLHRRNLLDSRFRELGVGYALSSAQRGYIAVDLALDSSYAPVIIENEAPTTTVRTVQLYIYDQATRAGFTGQDASQEMMIANDPDFTDAVWQPYTVESSWALTEGEGWKTVYVKTRDLLGRTVTAQDSIYFGASLPRDELDFAGASRFGTGFRLEQIDAGAWPQVQFSLDWVGDDSDPNFLSGGARFEDAAAIGGTAVRLSDGDNATLWSSGYLAALPATAYFRIKVSHNRTTQDVVQLRVVGAGGEAGVRVLRGVDFAAADSYQEFAVPYSLDSEAASITFRIDRLGDAEVIFDAVTLYTAPRPVTVPLQWQSPDGYLRNCGVQARFVDAAGAFSPAVEVHRASGRLAAPGNPIGLPQLTVTPRDVWFQAAPDTTVPPPAQLRVQCLNCDDGPWQATTAIGWLQLSASTDGIEIALLPDELTPGIYQGEVVISAPTETGLAPVRVQVTAVIGDVEALLPQKLYLPTVVR